MQIPVLNHERFYVYEHIRRDTGSVFYVGKGTGNRAKVTSPHHRNLWWQRIVKKANGFDIRFVLRDVDEELAFLVEIERINQLRKIGVELCNMTDGGDGTAGWVKTPEWRKKVGLAHRGRFVSEETRLKISESVKRAAYVHTLEARAKISAANVGKKRTLGRIQPEEEKKKRSLLSIGNKSRAGQIRSAEERLKQSFSMKGKKQKILTCPNCGKLGGNSMRRWHFDACKKVAL